MPCLHCTQHLSEVKKRSPHAAPDLGDAVVWGERETLGVRGENYSLTRCGACGAVWEFNISIEYSTEYFSSDPRENALHPIVMGTLLYARVLEEAALQQALTDGFFASS